MWHLLLSLRTWTGPWGPLSTNGFSGPALKAHLGPCASASQVARGGRSSDRSGGSDLGPRTATDPTRIRHAGQATRPLIRVSAVQGPCELVDVEGLESLIGPGRADHAPDVLSRMDAF